MLFVAAWRILCFMVIASFCIAGVAILFASWIIVALVGLVHPRLTPRRACDWYRDFLHTATALVRELAE
jgi:hypothetical protein